MVFWTNPSCKRIETRAPRYQHEMVSVQGILPFLSAVPMFVYRLRLLTGGDYQEHIRGKTLCEKSSQECYQPLSHTELVQGLTSIDGNYRVITVISGG